MSFNLQFMADGRMHGRSTGSKPVSLIQGQFDDMQGVYLWGEMMAIQLRGTLDDSEELKEAIIHGDLGIVTFYTSPTPILNKYRTLQN